MKVTINGKPLEALEANEQRCFEFLTTIGNLFKTIFFVGIPWIFQDFGFIVSAFKNII